MTEALITDLIHGSVGTPVADSVDDRGSISEPRNASFDIWYDGLQEPRRSTENMPSFEHKDAYFCVSVCHGYGPHWEVSTCDVTPSSLNTWRTVTMMLTSDLLFRTTWRNVGEMLALSSLYEHQSDTSFQSGECSRLA